jgi:hypothetical protein
MTCSPDFSEDGRIACKVHGSYWSKKCLTREILNDIAAQRAEQFTLHGSNRDIPDGTGPDVQWFPLYEQAWWPTASEIEDLFREDWDWPKDGTPQQKAAAYGEMTWLRLLREEAAEAFATDNEKDLEAELLQVAALATSWIEKIRERRMA